MKWFDRYLQRTRINKASRFIPLGSTVLDVGSFDGKLFKILGNKLKSGIGIDPLIQNEEKFDKFQLLPGSFPDIELLKNQFDVISILAVLEHLPSSRHLDICQTCHKLLKPQGVLIISVPSVHADIILFFLQFLGIIDGMSLDEHQGFLPSETLKIFPAPYFKLQHHEHFQFKLNNLYVLEKIELQNDNFKSSI